MGRKRCRFAFGAAAVLSAGCYTYVPSNLDTVVAGTDIRALVSTEGQVKLLNDFGINSRSITGTLESRSEERVQVAVRALYSVEGPGARPLYQHVELPPRDLLRIEVKRFSPFRTWGFVGLLAGSAGAIVIMAATGTFEGGSQPPPGGQPPGR